MDSPLVQDMSGVDPLQALVLAIAYLNIDFGALLRAGWLFYLDAVDCESFDPCSTYFLPANWEPAA